jgi:hypothetical protein
MELLVISIALVVCIYLVWPRRQLKVRGRFSDLPSYLGGLMAANNPHAFLVVDFPGNTHLVQFCGDKSGVQLDMPLFTPEQISVRSSLEAVCRNEGFSPKICKGSDGNEFLDCDIDGECDVVVSAAENILASVFGVKRDDKVIYTLAGYCKRVAPC